MTESPILIIGSTGKTGRRIVQKLREQGFRIREGSRHSQPVFDWTDPVTWPAAVAGVKAAYISYYPDLAAPGAPGTIEKLTACAREAGVERLVLLSGRGEHNAQRCEEIVRHSGLEYTLIRSSWFAQNFSEGALLGPVLSGMVAMPADGIREPFIDADDIAGVAVAALTDGRHAGQLYEVTGPRLMTFAEAVQEIAGAAGREVAYQPITLDQFHTELTHEAGSEMADLLTDLCREVFDGRNESLGDGVQRALGRPPRDFADFVRSAAAAGVWR
ncbi:MAG: NAD(P)H-binding protein [Desulfosarcinaceae bacterium]|jgi:uncharacterized protein YbjT (DUF2867 family)